MKRRFEALDAFRGICAISVVMFHISLIGSVSEWSFFRGSAIFVEFFFVLSGFVLAHGYGYKTDLKFAPFVKSRFFRLYPLHLFMFLVFIIFECGKLAAYKFAGLEFNNVPFTGMFAISEILPNLLLLQSWTPYTNHLSFNSLSWSISVEFYMYLLLFTTIVTFKKNKPTLWLCIAITTLILLSTDSEALTKPVLRGLSCFFGGAYIYSIFDKYKNLAIPSALGSIIELMLVVAVFIVVSADFPYKNITAICLFYTVVLFFAYESGSVSKLLKRKAFQTAGTLSYSIYMTHYAVLFILTSIMIVLQKISGYELAPVIDGVRTLTTGSYIGNSILTLVIIAVVIYISSLTHRYIELNGQQMGKKF